MKDENIIKELPIKELEIAGAEGKREEELLQTHQPGEVHSGIRTVSTAATPKKGGEK